MKETKENANFYTVLSETKHKNSVIEFEAQIEAEHVNTFRKKAIKKLGERTEMPGFRPGHIPEDILVKKFGEMAIFEEMAEEAINESVPLLLVDKKVNFISRPEISITSIAPGNPLKFKIKIAYLPEVSLPDYKKLAAKEVAKKEDKPDVTEKELADTVEQVKKMAGRQLGMKEGELPELTDDFVKKLGGFENVAAFKDKLKADMIKEKETKQREKKRLDIAEAIIAKTDIDLPDALVEYELDKLEAQFAGDLENMGIKMADYLERAKKTKEQMRKDWRTDAEKRAKLELVITNIALTEKIVPTDAEINKETDHVLAHYKDADKESVKRYVERALTNQKVFEFLENQK